MNRKKTLCLLLLAISLVACGSQDENINFDKQENLNMENNTEEYETSDIDETDEVEEVLLEPGELRYCGTVNWLPILEVNEEKVAAAVDLGFPDPGTQIEEYSYASRKGDLIQYTMLILDFDLNASFKHQGFGDLELLYEEIDYSWADDLDELEAEEYTRKSRVILKGNSIYIEEGVGEYQTNYTYYDENIGIYYEVQEILMGYYSDENSERVEEKYGQFCNYGAFETLTPPTYNPLTLRTAEEFSAFVLTELEGKACVYYETLYDGSMYKRWVSLSEGVLVKELVFSAEGLIKSEKSLLSISYEPVDASVFQAPIDVEYIDISPWVYALEGGDLETLRTAVLEVLPGGDTGIVLTDEKGDIITLFARESDDGLVEDVIYDKSSKEGYFFDFENVVLLGVRVEEDVMRYAFYKPDNLTVGDFYEVYEYMIEDGRLKNIRTYRIEDLYTREIIGVMSTYQISLIDFDESLYDQSF